MDVDLFNKHRDELADMWQGRALRATRKDSLGLVMLSMIAHGWPDAFVVLLYAAFPDFKGEIFAPFICSTAKIDHDGSIVADVILPNRPFPYRDMRIFKSEVHMRDRLRKLADELKLSDAERIELFLVAHNWCAADRRLDPNFDPLDPDAKRIIH